MYISYHLKSGDLRAYADGLPVHRVADDRLYHASFVTSQNGSEGWISSVLLQPTHITKKDARKQVEWKAAEIRLIAEERARRAERQRERAKGPDAETEALRANCAAIFQSTADRRVSDLTVRESEQVNACQTLGMCH
jgi:hypothetical protein